MLGKEEEKSSSLFKVKSSTVLLVILDVKASMAMPSRLFAWRSTCLATLSGIIIGGASNFFLM